MRILADKLHRNIRTHIVIICAFLLVFVCSGILSAAISADDVAVEPEKPAPAAQPAKQAVVKASEVLSADSVAVEDETAISENDIAVEDDCEISADDVAVEEPGKTLIPYKPQKIKTPPSQIVQYARNFWDDAGDEIERRKINISGTKTFDLKQANVSGDLAHFSTNNYDCIPGFTLDQSLHLEIDGNITDTSSVHAVLDDTEDEDRRFTVNIDGPVWKFVMGDFQLALDDTDFALYRKEVRGVMAAGSFHKNFQSIFLFSQSKGAARREQFRGAGQQQEFTLNASPIVENSEKVTIDGEVLTRGTDYYVDYEDGIIKFQPSVLPIEATRWIVIEYEVADDSLAFTRNLFGTRQVYQPNDKNHIGVTWLREVDSSSPKSGDAAVDASGTVIMPMQLDVYETDFKWQLTKGISAEGEAAVSVYDPNRNSNENDSDRSVTGHAGSFGLSGSHKKADGQLTYRRIDSDFQSVGRTDGVVTLGERDTLVNDVLSGLGKFNYRFDDKLNLFTSGEKSETNIDDDPTLSTVDYKEYTGGFIWQGSDKNRLEVRGGFQRDSEIGDSVNTDITKHTGSAVWDKTVGKLKTQTKAERISYDDAVSPASSTESLELGFNMGAQADKTFSWSTAASYMTTEDGYVTDEDRSKILNCELDLNYEPNRVLSARSLFQWRREQDNYENTRIDTEVADAQIRYEPSRDLRTQLKYKIENTSTILRDDTLDDVEYIAPDSLDDDDDDILQEYDAPVQKTTFNFITDYQLNKHLQTYFDWRRRDVVEQTKDELISTTDRKSYELRYTPADKMMITAEYEEGITKNAETPSNLWDDIRSAQFRYEFSRGYILDTTYEEKEEDDRYDNTNDSYTITKIAEFQRVFSPKTTLELNLQHDKIDSSTPSTEFKKEVAVVLTPSSRNQRYRFYANHTDIDADISGKKYEIGLSFSQFIGTDTIIDGEIKKLNSTETADGAAYDATVVNAKMVITF